MSARFMLKRNIYIFLICIIFILSTIIGCRDLSIKANEVETLEIKELINTLLNTDLSRLQRQQAANEIANSGIVSPNVIKSLLIAMEDEDPRFSWVALNTLRDLELKRENLPDINLVINGEAKEYSISPVFIKSDSLNLLEKDLKDVAEIIIERKSKTNSQIYVPLRAILKELNFLTLWEEKEDKITVISGNQEIKLRVNDSIVTTANFKKSLDYPVIKLDNQVMAPVKMLSEVFHISESWNFQEHTLYIGGQKYASGGSKADYPLINALDGEENTQWKSAIPIGAPEGGKHQFIRIYLGEDRVINQVLIRNWNNINSPLRIYASNLLTDNVEDFISYKLDFLFASRSTWNVAPAQPRSYERIAEIPLAIDNELQFDFANINKRYLYIVFEGFKTPADTKYLSIGDIEVNFVDSDLYQLPTVNSEDLQSPVFDVFDYGAVGDGVTPDTEALQLAVNAAHEAGGGTVWIHNGIFATGAVRLKSNVRLYIDVNAIVLAYAPANRQGYEEHFSGHRYQVSVFYAEEAENITIEGRGAIHGNHNAPLFAGTPGSRQVRVPYLLWFLNSSEITIRDIILKNVTHWVQHYDYVDNLLIDNIIVDSVGTMTSDGLDVSNSHNVTIKNSYILSDDDSIVLKSSGQVPGGLNPTHYPSDKIVSGREPGVSNVLVENNVVYSLRNSGLMIGTETSWPFKDIVFRNNVVTGASRYGALGVSAVDGSNVENIYFENIYIKGGVPLYVRLGNRDRFSRGEIGSINNVNFTNIHATATSRMGMFIAGIPGHLVKNVNLTDIWIEKEGYRIPIPGTPSEPIPEPGDFHYGTAISLGTLPAYGFYLRHVKDILFDNVNLRTRRSDSRDWLVIDEESINVDIQNSKDYGTAQFDNYLPFEVLWGESDFIERAIVYDDQMINAAVWSLENDLQVHDRIYGDGQFVLSYLPDKLKGNDWIRPALASSYYTEENLIEFSLNKEATVYVAALATPYSKQPLWLEDWKIAREKIMVRRGGTGQLYQFNLYKKDFSKGSTVIMNANDVSNYNEIISQLPAAERERATDQRWEVVYPGQYFIIITPKDSQSGIQIN